MFYQDFLYIISVPLCKGIQTLMSTRKASHTDIHKQARRRRITQKNLREQSRLRRVRKIVKEFSCAVCYNSLLEKQCSVAMCGHTLCDDCWASLPRPLQCPLCRQVLPEGKMEFFRGSRRLEVSVGPTPNVALNNVMTELRDVINERYVSEDREFARAIKREDALMAQESKAKKTKK